jgi:tetratricopeptide (TPR) repeat protein
MGNRALLVFLLLAVSVSAQLDNQSMLRRVTVRVIVPSGNVCDATIAVRLIARGGPVESGYPKSDCTVEFANISPGTYHIAASGLHYAAADTGNIVIDSSGPIELEIKLDRNGAAQAGDSVPSSPLVGVAELNVPRDAKKKFDKASLCIAKQDWQKALDELAKAVTIYPRYVDAYNNIGVVYARLGDRAKELDALQKALSINDRYAPAYLNLGRMNIVAEDFPKAETALTQAHEFDPSDSTTLALLAYAEFMDRRYDEAIATSRHAHTVPQGGHAIAHQVAARAFEQKHDAVNAIAELQLFLKEEPTGSRAEAARKELAGLRAIRAESVPPAN